MISKINYNDKTSFGQIHFSDSALELLNNRKISSRLKEELKQLQMTHRDIDDVNLYFKRRYKERPILSTFILPNRRRRYREIATNFLKCELYNKNDRKKEFKETFITRLLTGPIGFIKSLAKRANKIHTQNQNLEDLKNSLK